MQNLSAEGGYSRCGLVNDDWTRGQHLPMLSFLLLGTFHPQTVVSLYWFRNLFLVSYLWLVSELLSKVDDSQPHEQKG